MKASELIKKAGYIRRYNDNCFVIYDLKEKQHHCNKPESFIIRKSDFSVEFTTENAENYIHLGSCGFQIDYELMTAIMKKIEELKNK